MHESLGSERHQQYNMHDVLPSPPFSPTVTTASPPASPNFLGKGEGEQLADFARDFLTAHMDNELSWPWAAANSSAEATSPSHAAVSQWAGRPEPLLSERLQAVLYWKGAVSDARSQLQAEMDAAILPLVSFMFPPAAGQQVNQEVPMVNAAGTNAPATPDQLIPRPVTPIQLYTAGADLQQLLEDDLQTDVNSGVLTAELRGRDVPRLHHWAVIPLGPVTPLSATPSAPASSSTPPSPATPRSNKKRSPQQQSSPGSGKGKRKRRK